MRGSPDLRDERSARSRGSWLKEVFDATFRWIADHGMFAESGMGSCQYEESIAKLA